jgi:hypothetical protein
MAVDTNIGFNKTNAVVESSLSYDVDLTNPSAPTSSLTVIHKNNADEIVFCKQWGKVLAKGEQGYPITDCYWNYLRIYMTKGTKLLGATPQSVPDNWMILQQKKQGQVDVLQEDVAGVQAFGSLQVVRGGQSLPISFQFALPPNVLKTDSGKIVYYLKAQKQPGTLAPPITIRVHLANNASIETVPTKATIDGHNITYQTNLATDFEFKIVFSVQ